MKMQTSAAFPVNNKNRALVCYFIADEIQESNLSTISNTIKAAIRGLGTSIATCSTVLACGNVVSGEPVTAQLAYGNQRRTLHFISGAGDLAVGVMFFNGVPLEFDEEGNVISQSSDGAVVEALSAIEGLDVVIKGSSTFVVPTNVPYTLTVTQ